MVDSEEPILEDNKQIQSGKLTVREDSVALSTTSSQDDETEIVLQSAAESGLQLSRLSCIDTLAMAKVRCREITAPAQGTAALAQTAQGALPALVQSQVLQAAQATQTQMLQSIAKQAPNGLFTATVSPDILKTYNDTGTFSSMVWGPGKGGRSVVKSHHGFQQVSLPEAKAAPLPSVNPIAVIGGAMQAMAMVSGQYYMHQLSNQLKSMGKQLDRLNENHNNEKIGVLRSVSVTIAELTSKRNPDTADLIRIQDAAVKAQEIFHEYLTRLDKIDAEEIAGSKKAQTYLSEAKIKALRKRLDDSEIIFIMQVCFQASLLVEKCKAAEIAIRIRLNGYDARTAEDLRALVDGMGNTFHGSNKDLCKEYLQPVLRQDREYAKNGIDKKIQTGVQTGVGNIQTSLRQAFATVENDKTAQKIKIAGIAKLGREAVDGSMVKAQQHPKKQLTDTIEQYLQSVEEAFQVQSKDNRTMITSIDRFFRAPRTLFYLPGNSGEERVFVVEEGNTSRAQ